MLDIHVHVWCVHVCVCVTGVFALFVPRMEISVYFTVFLFFNFFIFLFFGGGVTYDQIHVLSVTCCTIIHLVHRPGGELMPGEDEIDGLKRSMTEVSTYSWKFRIDFDSALCANSRFMKTNNHIIPYYVSANLWWRSAKTKATNDYANQDVQYGVGKLVQCHCTYSEGFCKPYFHSTIINLSLLSIMN